MSSMSAEYDQKAKPYRSVSLEKMIPKLIRFNNLKWLSPMWAVHALYSSKYM